MRFLLLLWILCGLPEAMWGQTAPERLPVPASSSPVRLRLHIQHVWNGVPLRFDDLHLTNRAGNTLSISRLAYLMSDVTLHRADGASVTLHSQYGYINASEQKNDFALNPVPAGHYSSLSFYIGLAPQVNHTDPSRYASDHPLNPLVNNLHWGWQGGYVFLALEGRYLRPDATRGGYSYHIGTDANRMKVMISHPFEITTDGELTMQCDVARVFDGAQMVAISADDGAESTHSAPGDSLAMRLKTNAEQAFTFASLTFESAKALKANSANSGKKVPTKKIVVPLSHPYPLTLPVHFPRPHFPTDNPLTLEGVALGKTLFFDKRLSGNNSQSCASCHVPERAFSSGKALSPGIDGKPGTRRAMPLFNLAWSSDYTWDGRRARLRDQVLAPIQDTREMHQTLARAISKLKQDRNYPHLFARAFGDAAITPTRLSLAVEQYLLTLISADAKFDRAIQQQAEFTDEEKRGLLLFITEYDPARGKVGADCFHCHGGNLFTDYRYKNNGLDADFRDMGRYVVTKQEADRGKFKTPSLRNVELTGPYMHDGRFKTLEDVVEHYNQHVRRSDTLDPNIAKHPEEGLSLSADDKRALVAFLKTLTDIRFSRPSPTSHQASSLH